MERNWEVGETLEIVYRDDDLVAINKPSGLLVHRSPIDKHETRFALQMLRDQIGQHVFPVHRLDKPTSGLLLFALSPEVARNVSLQFEEGTVKKTYHAVIRGHAPQSLFIDHPLRDETDAEGRKINDGTVRDAQTELECEKHWTLPIPVDRYPEARYSLVVLKPKTGRTRQLRRHMKHIAYPIIGDVRYGKGTHNRFFREHFGCERLMLASVGLNLIHPESGIPLEIFAKPSANFSMVIDMIDQQSLHVDV